MKGMVMEKIREWMDSKARRIVARILTKENEAGHNRLCRFVSWVCHWGPHGTFVLVHTEHLKTGGMFCIYGSECGKPTESYMRQMHERMEAFHHVERMLRENGGLVSMVWENVNFSSSALCSCGNATERAFPSHAPLCEYRVKHDFPISVDEYKEAVSYSN